MKHFKRICLILLVLAVFAGSFALSFFLFNRGSYDIQTEYITIFDDEPDAYYLSKAAADIVFIVDVDSKTDNAGYSLYDSDGNPIMTKTERLSATSFNILPPSDGYAAGCSYTLTLTDNAHFHNSDIADARKLVFCIEKKKTESYALNESVVTLENKIEEIDEDTVSVANIGVEAKEGMILFSEGDDGEYLAYKIVEVNRDGTAEVVVPALDEIYSELEIYGEYEWDVTQIAANPDLEIEILENVKNSSFYESLLLTAYADEDKKDGSVEINITPNNAKKSLEIELKFTLEPGENGLFGISKLKNQKVTISLNANIYQKTKCNIQGFTDWDVSASLTTDFSWSVDIDLYNAPYEKDSDLEGLFSEDNKFANLIDYHDKVKQISEKLDQIAADASGGNIKLFKWNLPVPSVPGLYFSADVKLFANFEMAANINVGQRIDTVYTVGVCMTDGDFKPYSNTYRSGGDVELSFRGKAEFKAGIMLEISANLINDNVAKISIDPQVGFYSELYITIPILGNSQASEERFAHSYFEPGVYFSANVKAKVNLLLKKLEFSKKLAEKKIPIKAWVLGNDKIAYGIESNTSSVRAVEGVVTIPDILFEYYDVKKGMSDVEKLSFEDLKFVAGDGTRLTVKNGKLEIPTTSTSGSLYVTASYLHTDKVTYTAMFKVILSGSTLEGKVSAYSEDTSASALEGATVKLYSANNNAAPINSALTDANGKFSFNVTEGDYTLEISADGYKTLTSNQSVDANEIKYTEHMLLMDDEQTGTGSAGGTVTNALNGRGVGGVQIKLREDWNKTSGTYVDFETQTNSSGKYTVSDIPVGYYTVEASIDGYVTGYSNIIVLSEDAKTDFDFTITPVLSGDEVRIVLTWGSSPSDLDSHLIGPKPSGGSFNVYYGSKVYSYEGTEMANLDVDDTTRYGPETITILEQITDTYTYAVHDYSNRSSSSSTALSFSGANVRVFIGSDQVAEFNVPTDQVGTYWTVFNIDEEGNILPINTVSNTKPAA